MNKEIRAGLVRILEDKYTDIRGWIQMLENEYGYWSINTNIREWIRLLEDEYEY